MSVINADALSRACGDFMQRMGDTLGVPKEATQGRSGGANAREARQQWYDNKRAKPVNENPFNIFAEGFSYPHGDDSTDAFRYYRNILHWHAYDWKHANDPKGMQRKTADHSKLNAEAIDAEFSDITPEERRIG